MGDELARGTKVFGAPSVRGAWRRLGHPDDVLELMDGTAQGVIACVADAGATFLAPIFDETVPYYTPVPYLSEVGR